MCGVLVWMYVMEGVFSRVNIYCMKKTDTERKRESFGGIFEWP